MPDAAPMSLLEALKLLPDRQPHPRTARAVAGEQQPLDVAAAFRPKFDLKKVRWTAIKEIVGLFPERVAGLRRAQPASLNGSLFG